MAKEPKLKIGFVLDDSLDKTDGVQQYVLSVGEWLRSQGNDVHYLVGSTQRKDIRNIHSLSKNLSVRFNGNRMSMPLPSSTEKLRNLLRMQQFDVLHVQIPYSPYLAHRIIKEANDATAIVGTFHIVGESAVVKTATTFLGNWTKSTIKRFDEIVSVSIAAQQFALETFGIATKVVPNTIDYSRFHESTSLPELTDHKLVILFLGRLVPRKGCMTLLKALSILRQNKSLPQFQVLICGKGPLEAKLKNYAEQHDLTEIVRFVGYVSEQNKPHYYASSDISVFPSSGGESFGIVLLEAMASGHAAVIAGDNVGYRSVLKDRPELLFDPRDCAVLADKLTDYLLDTRLRKAAQTWGEQYAASFDTNVVGQELVSIYSQALRKRRKQ